MLSLSERCHGLSVIPGPMPWGSHNSDLPAEWIATGKSLPALAKWPESPHIPPLRPYGGLDDAVPNVAVLY